MDHLLIPEGKHHIIQVPYKSTELYDNGDFMTYPQRKGWTEDHIHGKDDYGGRSKDTIDSFFQTWLYFGCLIEVFKIGEIPIDIEDFIDRERGVLTSRKLPSLFVEWHKRWPIPTPAPECKCRSYRDPAKVVCHAQPCWKTFKIGRYSEEYRSIKSILSHVRRIANIYCFGDGVSRKPWAITDVSFPKCSVDPIILASIVALGYTLGSAVFTIYDISPSERDNIWGGTPLFRSLLKEKWCATQVTSMMTELDIDGHYYLSATSGPPEAERRAHLVCSDRKCVAEPMDVKTYEPKHVTREHDCRTARIPDDFLEIIKDKGTPIVSWVRGTGGQESRVVVTEHNIEKNKNPKYIAISHVWSDGMGNPKDNSLPECQMSRIQEMVDNVNFPGRQSGEHVGFWMDTLCIPVKRGQEELRKFCIVKMRHIYQSAVAVLVIESSLQDISATAPIADRCLCIYNTKWRRRLWTYQEGALAQELYFQYNDTSQAMRDLTDERFRKERALRDEGIYTSFLEKGDSVITSLFALLGGAVSRWIKDGTIKKLRWMAFLPVAGAFGSRQTTRNTDETLCAATVLGIDPSPFIEIERDTGNNNREEATQDVADRRMELLFRCLRKTESFIIFNCRPRLKAEGYRWAPRSLMGGTSDELGGASGATAGRTARFHHWGPGSSDVGLLVSFPAIKLRSPPQDLSATTFTVVNQGQLAQGRVQLVPDEIGKCPTWRSGVCYILVLASTPNKLGCVAVLGQQILPYGQLRHECLAWVEMKEPKTSDSDSHLVTGEYIPEKPWTIV